MSRQDDGARGRRSRSRSRSRSRDRNGADRGSRYGSEAEWSYRQRAWSSSTDEREAQQLRQPRRSRWDAPRPAQQQADVGMVPWMVMPEQPSVQPLIAETSDHSISSHTPTTLLAVRGLHVSTTEEDVAESFRQFAMIKKCTLVRDSVTQLSKGLAFVEFNALEYAVHVVNTLSSLTLTIGDCAVRVFYARPHALNDQLRHSNLAAAAQDAAARRQQSLQSLSLPTSSSSCPEPAPASASASASSSSSPDWPPPFERAGAAYVLHPQSGCFYEPRSQFYYSPQTRLYYSCRSGGYFRFDATAAAMSSQGEIGAFRPCMPPPAAPAVAAPELVDGVGEGEAAGSGRNQQATTTPAVMAAAVARPDTLDSLNAASRSSKASKAGKGPGPASAAGRALVEPVIISVGAAAAVSTESALVQLQGATDHHPSAATNCPSQSEAEADADAEAAGAEATSRYRDRASERRDMYSRAEAPPGLPVSALPRGAPTSAPALTTAPPPPPAAYPASSPRPPPSLFDNPSNPGAALLRSMGWTEGRGLGKSEQGLAVPLGVEIRPSHQPTSKAGIGAPKPPHAKGRVKVNYHGSKEEFKASLKDAARARFEQLGEK